MNTLSLLIPVGIILILVGFGFVFAGSFLGSREESKTNTHIGFGGFIGPFPFGFANSKTMFYVVVGIFIFFFVFWSIMRNTY